ncbi:DNA-binding protein [Streptomyces sp. LX-29]|uniref:PPC domain-containing DNA-binding protein n=1 Tax=Streptomyces sp. LX-29 TaxID=2900152 RepID=UPI00240E2F90|nr:PPC domain-containing DNA-binding protein [Streptomyces sp. LX-29]WFB08775.1 DNA-binding protein [Streptomyces sp. LX-29]
MRARELTVGRTFGITFDHGDDFFGALDEFCREHGICQGYIPMFIGAFSEAELVGTCEKLDHPEAPLWSRTHVETVEALGCGTLARDPETDKVLPHVHVAAGLKGQSAQGKTSHLLSARVQFLTELLVVEVTAPVMTRPRNPQMYDVPLLTFE